MAFDAAFRPERHESGTTQASSDLFNRIHSEHSGIKQASATGGALEPPGHAVIEPPTTNPGNTTVNNTFNNTARGGDARAAAAAKANAKATSSSGSNASSESIGPTINSKTTITAPPGLGGGECTVGVSGGALGFALGFQTPSMDCIKEKTGAQKDGQMLDFAVRSGATAVDAYDHALANVDRASDYHKKGDDGVAQAHLLGANAQRKISGDLASESLTAAQRVLGPDATRTANDGGAWGADILNSRAPEIKPEPAPVVVQHHNTVKHIPAKHVEVKKTDCPDVKGH